MPGSLAFWMAGASVVATAFGFYMLDRSVIPVMAAAIVSLIALFVSLRADPGIQRRLCALACVASLGLALILTGLFFIL